MAAEKRQRWPWAQSLLVAAVIATLGVYAVCDFLTVRGSSMQKTLQDGDKVIVLRADLFSAVPRAWDLLLHKNRVVVFRSPLQTNDLMIKRIVATEGDTVQIDGVDLIVNGRVQAGPSGILPFEAKWPPQKGSDGPKSYVVPHDHYFVLSDNRLQSLDSRAFGAVQKSLVVGVVVGPTFSKQ